MRKMSDSIAILGLKVSHRSKQDILRSLYDSRRPLRQFQIAEAIGKDSATVGHHLSELEKLGIVKKLSVDGIVAYSLPSAGRKLVEATNLGYLREEEEVDLHVMELASIAGIDPSSKTYSELKKTVAKWYAQVKERLRTKAEPDSQMYR